MLLVMLVSLIFLLATGLVQAVISPPLNLVVLHPVAWVPALLVFGRLSGRRALAAGWLVGTSATLAIFAWLPGTIDRFGGFPLPAALAVWLLFALAMGLHVGVFAAGYGVLRRWAGPAWPVAVAAWFCALEFLNPHLFGYLQGDAWYQVPRVFLVTAWTGVSGMSFLVLLGNAVVVQGLESLRGDSRSGRGWVANLALLAGLVLLAVVSSNHRLNRIAEAEATAPTLRIALVQPNHTIERRWALSRMESGAFAADLVSLSRLASARIEDARPVDVYVWPEGALRSSPARRSNAAAIDFVRESGAEVWTGADHRELAEGTQGEGRRRTVSFNSAFRIHGDGRIDPRYDKNILVPFGEYVPLKDVVPGFDRLHAVGNYEAGRTVPVFEAGPARFVFLICYEAIRSGFVRSALDDSVNLLVNVTVDAWYGDSAEQSQHLMLAAVQSALHGLPLVRSTTTGISAFVDARGMLVGRTGKYTRETLVRDVALVRVPSVYSRWGDWLAWGCVLASAWMLLASRRTRPDDGQSGSASES